MPQSAAIHGHPGAPWPPRCLAIRARPPPSRPVSPRGASHHPISLATGQFPSPARTHATLRGHRTPACLAPAVSAGRSAAPPYRCSAQRGRPSCVQTFCGPKVIRGGTPRPTRPGDRLARPTGQWPFVAHEGPDGLLALIPLESSQRDAESIPSSVGFLRRSRMANWRMKLVEEKEGGTLAHGRESHPEAPPTARRCRTCHNKAIDRYTTRLVLQSSAEDSSPREVTLQFASQLPGASP
ncbi:hypothetical protein AAWM_02993 [Aspergillus awamori]|uniref:Uncharacterized protein n=1 Tax=Aspergillus awamori TaxID=105351 RepID=A0A401KL56_ASPAW|nr:hypothetical protein AAWM_02993 [Aspergillus awamori]